jgi:hypothetical protein
LAWPAHRFAKLFTGHQFFSTLAPHASWHGDASGTLLAQKTPIAIGFLGASYSHFKGKFQVIRESSDWRLVGVVGK